ncbi:stage II sporulation protein E [Anaerobacillus alkalidiazotrophicus]|uniref:Stage II sporulation protein E n=2 Tax=Anaerobacillus alkalidiazotrophicus TaxID=472963 RepID=A0A1S2M7Q9_9BACI|nr:stage II sporulation protein E [Anaerobacillus alkalidiazotrophicus]
MFRKVLKAVEPMRGTVLSNSMNGDNYLKESETDRFGKLFSLIFYKWGFLIFIIGFLLGRAIILSEMLPFILPFFAAIFLLKREKSTIAMLALIAGAITIDPMNGGYAFVSILTFLFLYRLFNRLYDNKSRLLPFLVFAAIFISKTLLAYVLEGTITNYVWLVSVVEGGLSFILTMIFIQSVPIITERKRKHSLKNEEIICLIILLASVMTGTIGWIFYGMAAENILARYLVLIFAFVGGAAIGSTVGVVTGLILSLASVASLYQMSLLAFSGLLGGLLKDGKKIGVGIGLLVGTLLIGLYGDGSGTITLTVMESLVAILIFIITPRNLIMRISKYIPGTAEYWKEQQQYLRKFRDVTAGKVEQFSTLFQTLSNSFSSAQVDTDEEDPEREVDYFLSNVTEKTCQMCFRKEQCWTKNFDKTYNHMQEIMVSYENEHQVNKRLKVDWERYCLKAEKVIHVIQHELNQYHAGKKLKRQLLESRKLVADQLLGVSKVMGDFAKEIQKERENLQIQEEQILDALRDAGVDIGHVEIFQLDEGNVDIEISVPTNEHGECEKIVAPMLSHILEETIVVKKADKNYYPNGYTNVSFGSAKQFVVETGIATVAKGGAWISGDSYSTMEIGAGKYAVAISDGMGNGERAHLESNETLQLLQNILQSGIEETVAIKSVNSVLSLRSTDEIFSTLDLAMIDLQDASAKFLKIGSTPSFIKRGDKVFMVEASNLPMGIINEFDVDVVSEQLKAGDLLIMMSDGIFDGPKHVENSEAWMKRIIKEIKATEPQEVADLIIEQVIRTGDNKIDDDMTVVVANVKRNLPRWATIPMYQTVGLNRKKKAL